MRATYQEFLSALGRFRAHLGQLEVQVLKNLAHDQEQRAGVTMLMSAAFERFIRDLVKAYVEALAKRNIDFDRLPVSIRRGHFEWGAKHLIATERKDRESKPNTYGASKDVCRRLASVAGNAPYELVWEGFANTQSNPGPETVENVFKRLAVPKPWQAIESKAKDTYRQLPANGTLLNKLNADLEQLVEARNRCAHGGAHVAAPPYSELHEYLNSLEVLSGGMVTALEERLVSFPV